MGKTKKKMGMGSLLILLLMAIVGVLVGTGIYKYGSSQTVTIYLYSNDYKAGTPVTSDMFSSYEFPVDLYNALNKTGTTYAGVEEISDHMSAGESLLVDVVMYSPVMSNHFVSGGGTEAERRLSDNKVSVELSRDHVMGMGADIRIGSRINVITGYVVDPYKVTEMIFQNLLVVDCKNDADGYLDSIYVEVDPAESLELLHAINFETVQIEVVKPNSYEEVPAEKSKFERIYEIPEEDDIFNDNFYSDLDQ